MLHFAYPNTRVALCGRVIANMLSLTSDPDDFIYATSTSQLYCEECYAELCATHGLVNSLDLDSEIVRGAPTNLKSLMPHIHAVSGLREWKQSRKPIKSPEQLCADVRTALASGKWDSDQLDILEAAVAKHVKVARARLAEAKFEREANMFQFFPDRKELDLSSEVILPYGTLIEGVGTEFLDSFVNAGEVLAGNILHVEHHLDDVVDGVLTKRSAIDFARKQTGPTELRKFYDQVILLTHLGGSTYMFFWYDKAGSMIGRLEHDDEAELLKVFRNFADAVESKYDPKGSPNMQLIPSQLIKPIRY